MEISKKKQHERAADYHADRKGTAVIYEAMGEAICRTRACAPMTAGWKQKVDEDFKKRKNNFCCGV